MTTHDTYTKDANLKRTGIKHCDVLVVDEAQDCSAAQLAWLIGQASPRRLLFFIGDPAQSIYGEPSEAAPFPFTFFRSDFLTS